MKPHRTITDFSRDSWWIMCLLVISMSLAGCASRGVVSATTPLDKSMQEAFSSSGAKHDSALLMYEKGEYGRAGQMFLYASRKGNDHLQVRCLTAASLSFLRAGEWDSFEDAAMKLKDLTEKMEPPFELQTEFVLSLYNRRYLQKREQTKSPEELPPFIRSFLNGG